VLPPVSMVHFQKHRGRLVSDSEPFRSNVGDAIGKIGGMDLCGVREMNSDIGLPEFETLSWLNPLKRVANVSDYESDGATTEEVADG